MHHITSAIRQPTIHQSHLKRCVCGIAMVCALLCVVACSGTSGNAGGLHTQGPFSGIVNSATATPPPANSAAAAASAGDGGDDAAGDAPATTPSTLVPVQAATATPKPSAATSQAKSKIGAALLPADAQQQATALILDMITNIKANGYNSATNGLWINWRYGTDPLQANLNGSGKPDGKPTRHDRLTDLRYLRALLSYKSQHAGDTQFDGEITKYTAIVKGEFSGGDDRGWVYDEFAQLATISSDPWFSAMLQKTAAYYMTAMWHADTGMVYKTDAQHPNGYYRVDWAIEQACALMQAGVQFHHPEWTATGQHMMQFVRTHAYLSAYHIYPFMVDDVLSGGGANPDELFYSDTSKNKKTATNGSRVVLGETAQEIISLLNAYQATGDATLLHDATDMLDALSPASNTLGLWDSTHLGYFKQVTFSGTGVQNPGTLLLDNTKKEAGRQGQMLEAVALANTVTNNHYAAMEAAIFAVVSGPAYYRQGHGVLYEVRPDWSLVASKGSATGYQDWVTTEAMGIAMEGLFAVERQIPTGG